ncbi:hypothetical protein TR51_17110 [Kitasatospora griseola]|uniref:Uncharacterized protein n=1 Tax=Kitasatospora griseola TaxID=2064 RepID=A0A0D0NBD4_KITGR|nr:hypothetical protein [Kitasatospora griseola]KIQ65560.1 hypothetical protein TR51_17110 [Kitasatospora griseola]
MVPHLVAAPGTVVVQGADPAGWARAQQAGWDKLGPAQQWALEHVLGLEPLEPEQLPAPKIPPPRGEGGAQPRRRPIPSPRRPSQRPRGHKETLVLDDGDSDSDDAGAHTTVEISLGLFIANSRSRRTTIPAERAAR